jgi:hypothetical protein
MNCVKHLPPLPLRLHVLWLNAEKTLEIVLDNANYLLQHEAFFLKIFVSRKMCTACSKKSNTSVFVTNMNNFHKNEVEVNINNVSARYLNNDCGGW